MTSVIIVHCALGILCVKEYSFSSSSSAPSIDDVCVAWWLLLLHLLPLCSFTRCIITARPAAPKELKIYNLKKFEIEQQQFWHCYS